MQYTQDNDETYPCGASFYRNGYRGQGWAGEVFPYAKSTNLFTCPDDQYVPDAASIAQGYYPVSYAFNTNMSGPLITAKLDKPSMTVMLSEVTNCAGKITQGFADATSPGSNGGDDKCGNYLPDPGLTPNVGVLKAGILVTGALGFPYGRLCTMAPGRHTEASNFLCADGHAQWRTGRQVSTGISAKNTPQDPQSGTRASGTEYPGVGLTFSTL